MLVSLRSIYYERVGTNIDHPLISVQSQVKKLLSLTNFNRWNALTLVILVIF